MSSVVVRRWFRKLIQGFWNIARDWSLIKRDAQLGDLNVTIRHERHKQELDSASSLHLSDKPTPCGPAGLNWHLPLIWLLPRWSFLGQWQRRWGLKTQASTAGCSNRSPPLQLSEWQEAEVVEGIKRFRMNFSETLSKCCFPWPPLPAGPPPLKPEKPECLRQCERWSTVGTGTWRSTASHQCRLTDGSIQSAGQQRLNAWSKNPLKSHERWWQREANSFWHNFSICLLRFSVFHAGTFLEFGYLT